MIDLDFGWRRQTPLVLQAEAAGSFLLFNASLAQKKGQGPLGQKVADDRPFFQCMAEHNGYGE